MRRQVGRHDTPVAINDIGAVGGNRCAAGAGRGFNWIGRGHVAHAHANHGKRRDKEQAKHNQTPLGAGAGRLANVFVTLAHVFALNVFWVLALFAGL